MPTAFVVTERVPSFRFDLLRRQARPASVSLTARQARLRRRLALAPGRLSGILEERNRLATTEHAMMGAMSGGSLVLADAISSIQSFISVFTGVYVLIIFAYILTSWVRLPYSPTLNRIQRFLYDVCEPYLRVFRRFLPPFGPLDLSPIVGVFALILGARIVNSVLERLR